MVSTTDLTFPKPTLTVITAEPTHADLTRLKKEIFANALAVPSLLGGGGHGHLGLVMPAADYIALNGTLAFMSPPVPPPTAVIPTGATAAATSEAVRQWNAAVTIHALVSKVRAELKKQLIAAVDPRYLETLEDDLLGLATVTTVDMLDHLTIQYGTLTLDDLVKNRAALSADWNPSDGIESLWSRIAQCQRTSQGTSDVITDSTAITLVLTVLDNTGVFSAACEKWRDRTDPATLTLPAFKTHLTKQNKERLRKLTAGNAGFHGAHAAEILPPPASAAAASAIPSAHVPTALVDGLVKLYYCWSHGLSPHSNHTSRTCLHPKEGHDLEATVMDRRRGSNFIKQPSAASQTRRRPNGS
jgi:hypothetical protein